MSGTVGALVLALGVALGGGSAAGASPSAGTEVLSGSYAGKVDGASIGVAVIADRPRAEGQPRTISIYVCNGTSLAAFLTGQTTSNSAVLRSEDRRFNARVALAGIKATGVLVLPDGTKFGFAVNRTAGVVGLFDVTVTATGGVSGRSPSGATLTGHVGVGDKLLARGTVVATATAGGQHVKLTAFARHLTAGAYRWIVLTNRKVYGASVRGPGSGGIGGLLNVLRPRGKGVVRITDAGSAGQPGYDDEKCRGLVQRYGHAVNRWANAVANNLSTAKDWEREALDTATELEDHCLVVE